ncbi:type II toxin-antitoxin system VapC family toxin [soil metagenome]
MSRYLIDTDWVVDVLRGHQSSIQALREIAADGLAISIITYGELIEGAIYARDPARAQAGLEHFLKGIAILPLTVEIMVRFGHVRGGLRGQGNLIGDLDLLIGVTAVHHELELISRNRRHFDRIPDLNLYSGSS